jgi:hypothetical protein
MGVWGLWKAVLGPKAWSLLGKFWRVCKPTLPSCLPPTLPSRLRASRVNRASGAGHKTEGFLVRDTHTPPPPG